MTLDRIRVLTRCTGCKVWLRPGTFSEPADLAVIDPVAQVTLGEKCGCAERAEEKVAEAAERRGR